MTAQSTCSHRNAAKTVACIYSHIGAAKYNEDNMQTLIKDSDTQMQVDSKHSPRMSH